MCLAIPARVISHDPSTETAEVSLDGLTRRISVALLDEIAVGDHVLVHVGYALNRISEEEAEHTLSVMREAGLIDETLGGNV